MCVGGGQGSQESAQWAVTSRRHFPRSRPGPLLLQEEPPAFFPLLGPAQQSHRGFLGRQERVGPEACRGPGPDLSEGSRYAERAAQGGSPRQDHGGTGEVPVGGGEAGWAPHSVQQSSAEQLLCVKTCSAGWRPREALEGLSLAEGTAAHGLLRRRDCAKPGNAPSPPSSAPP